MQVREESSQVLGSSLFFLSQWLHDAAREGSPIGD